MKGHFRTVKQATSVETIVKKSRFISYVKPVSEEKQALSFIDEIRRIHPEASHHCYAFVLDERVQRASDDGEPAGTAGRPILDAIKHLNLKYTAVVVARWFGGTMLGTGGLIRAYGEAAMLGLQAAGPVEQRLHVELFVECDYHWLSRIEHELRVRQWLHERVEYAERVRICLLAPVDEEPEYCAMLTEWTNGQVELDRGQQKYCQS